MPLDETQVTETTETVPAANTEVSESTASNASSDSASAASGGGSEAPAYTPNYKYKVADQEKEFADWVKPLIKDPELENKFKDVFTKVDAFDFQKSKREKVEAEREQLAKEYGQMQSWVKGTIGLKEKDLEQFFNRVNLSDQQVMAYVLNKLEAEEKLKDLPPHLRQAYNEHAPLKRRLAELEESNQQVMNQYQSMQIEARARDLDSTLSAPEVAALVAEYDQRAGAPGAFKRQVIRHGDAEFRDSQGQKDLTPSQAVAEVLSMFGLRQATQGAGQAPKPNETASGTPKVVVQPNAAVIPNVGKGAAASSAGGRKPKSIDEIRAIAKSMQEAG